MPLTDILAGYQSFSAQHPWVSSGLTAQVLLPLCDVISQKAAGQKMNWKQTGYMGKLAYGYGLSLHAIMGTGAIPEKLGVMPSAEAHPDMHALLMGALGPNLWGQGMNAFLFVNRAVGEKTDYSVRSLGSFYANITNHEGVPAHSLQEGVRNAWHKFTSQISKKDYLLSFTVGMTAWNVAQYANFRYVPESLQTAATIGASLLLTPITLFAMNRGAVAKAYEPAD